MLEAILKFFLKLMPKSIQDLFYKYESVWRYCYYGAWTTVVSIISKLVGQKVIEAMGYSIQSTIPNLVNTTISWVIAVTFAFVVNKKYVFMSKTNTTKELMFEAVTFYGGRVVTYFLEAGIMLLTTSYLKWNYVLMTILTQFIILAINYVISKLVTFRKSSENQHQEQ